VSALSEGAITTRLDEALGGRVVEMTEASPRRVYVEARASDVPAIARAMLVELGARLQTVTGVDVPPDSIEVLYHWALDEDGYVVTVRTRLERARPRIESIAAICPAAEWIEREVMELFGVEFTGHPDPRHLLLGDDWPEGAFPLRRDYRRRTP